jgi:hypothetical protein
MSNGVDEKVAISVLVDSILTLLATTLSIKESEECHEIGLVMPPRQLYRLCMSISQ